MEGRVRCHGGAGRVLERLPQRMPQSCRFRGVPATGSPAAPNLHVIDDWEGAVAAVGWRKRAADAVVGQLTARGEHREARFTTLCGLPPLRRRHQQHGKMPVWRMWADGLSWPDTRLALAQQHVGRQCHRHNDPWQTLTARPRLTCASDLQTPARLPTLLAAPRPSG